MERSNSIPKIRVVVVDDHPLVREALCAAIADEGDMAVVGQAEDGRQAVAEAMRCRPDTIVMDLLLPEMAGVDAIRVIKRQLPETNILALTSSTDATLFFAALEAGATGYLVKDTGRPDLLEAIRKVAAGNVFLSAPMATRLAGRLRTGENHGLSLLSEREHEVLVLIGTGKTNREVADALQVSDSTVRTHVQHILEKLGIENRNQAMLYALRTGLTL